MAKELNLLPEKKSVGNQQTISLLRKYSVSFLVFVVAVEALVFGVGQFLAFQEVLVQKDNAQLADGIVALKDREILLRLTKQKAAGIKAILQSDPKLNELVAKVKVLLPAGAEITQFGALDDRTFSVTLLADNSATLDNFVSSITDRSGGGSSFSSISVASATRAEGKLEYELKMNMRFNDQ